MYKQIEEMLKIIWENPSMSDLRVAEDIAYDLYNAGYRKASDVAREIFAEIDKTAYGDSDFFKQLKKKYESEGADDELP